LKTSYKQTQQQDYPLQEIATDLDKTKKKRKNKQKDSERQASDLLKRSPRAK
jgi:hypothetical protein